MNGENIVFLKLQNSGLQKRNSNCAEKRTCWTKNDGNNYNHGGFSGFHSKRFDYREDNGKIVFSSFSKDGEGGFPGNIPLDGNLFFFGR